MYKTIRQGENSLQYTILPQQDEGRNGNGASVGHRRGGSRSGSRKKSIAAYIGLFFICTIITFAILIPLMVTSDLMPTPASWFYRNQKGTRDFRTPVSVKLSVDHQENANSLKGTPIRTQTATLIVTSTSTTQKPTTIAPFAAPQKSSNHGDGPLWSDALTVTEFQNLYKSDESMEQSAGGPNGVFVEDDSLAQKTTLFNGERTVEQIEPTATVKNLLLARSRQRLMGSSTTTTTTTGRPSTLSSPRNYPKHFSLQSKQNEKVTPETRKPLQLQPDTKAIQVNANGEDMEKVHPNWLQAHWSYVDLQWRNYAAEDDRVVLPIILGIALAMIIVIMLLCYLVKRKRVCKKKATANNRSENVEAQEDEDHANLLTNENQSEEE